MEGSRRFMDTPKGSAPAPPRCVVGRCCCFSLRTATLLIAALETVFFALGVLAVILAELTQTEVPREPVSGRVVILVSGLVHLVVASLLLHGVRKRRRWLVEAWLSVRGVTLVTEVLLGMVRVTIDQQLSVLAFLAALAGFMLAAIIVVRSYLYKMQEEESGDGDDRGRCSIDTQELGVEVVISHDVSKALVPLQEYKGVVTRF